MQRTDHVPESDRTGDETPVNEARNESPDVAEPVVPDQSAYSERPLPGTTDRDDDPDRDRFRDTFSDRFGETNENGVQPDEPETPAARTDETPTALGRPAALDPDREDAAAHATSSEAGESRHAETTHDAGDEGRRDTKIEAGDSAPHRATGEHVLDPDLSTAYQERWRELQATFVDDPAAAVHSAEELVMELTTELSNAVTRRREELSGSENGETSDTEELRTTLRTYREIMQRLLEV